MGLGVLKGRKAVATGGWRMLGGLGSHSKGASFWYWTSTEVKENNFNQVWLISMADGSIIKAPKTNSNRTRLIVKYNPYE